MAAKEMLAGGRRSRTCTWAILRDLSEGLRWVAADHSVLWAFFCDVVISQAPDKVKTTLTL